jgi:hypothetical protein
MKNFFYFLLFFVTFGNAAQAFEPVIKSYKFCNYYEFKFAFLKIYDVFLCNNQTKNPDLKNLYSQDFALVIKYSQNIKSQKLVETSIDEIKKTNQLNDTTKQNYAKKLTQIFPNVKTNDIIIASYQASSCQTVFTLNNKKTGEILECDFSQKFLNIWLGQKVSYPKMRDALLKQSLVN